jgi:hypothetical protein
MKAKRLSEMTVIELMHHCIADWDSCKEDDDPLIDRVAAIMAHHVLAIASVEMTKLKAERDEARRMYCQVASDCEHDRRSEIPENGSPEDYARNEGWDCFKEDANAR